MIAEASCRDWRVSAACAAPGLDPELVDRTTAADRGVSAAGRVPLSIRLPAWLTSLIGLWLGWCFRGGAA